MALSPYATPLERTWHIALRLICAAVLLFLIAPIIVIMPLSFNSESFFTYPMPGLSLQWYRDFFTNERWMDSVFTSLEVAISVTIIATTLGILASLGLSRLTMRGKAAIIALIL